MKMKPKPIIIIPTAILKIEVAKNLYLWSTIQKTETKYPNNIINNGFIDWNQLAGISNSKMSTYLSVFS